MRASDSKGHERTSNGARRIIWCFGMCFAVLPAVRAEDAKKTSEPEAKAEPTPAAAEVPTRDALKISAQVDALIDAQLHRKKLPRLDAARDFEFLRRISVDVAGTTPDAERARRFLASEEKDRRQKLVDEVLDDEKFGRQFGRVWRDWIAPAELPSEGNGGNQPITATRNLGKWFAEQFNAGTPWNQIVSGVVNVKGHIKENPQGLFFSLTGTDTGIPEPAGATRAISSLFLGIDVQCAQCHDDPYRDWKQNDFWGVAAFFRNLEAKFDGRYFGSLKESFGRPSKGAKKTTTRDRSPNGSITIPRDSFKNAGDVVMARFVLGDKIEAKAKEALRPAFTEWLVSAKNPYFARAFVNRSWAYLFGRGIIEPVDDMRPSVAPSVPGVLELLTKEFIASDFDVKHLFRCILNTKTYQRSSLATSDAERSARDLFGRAPVKLLSADQLRDSLRQALGDSRLDLHTYDRKRLGKFGESSPVGDEYTEFQRLFETDENDPTAFTFGIPQFLALLNHPTVTSGGRTVAELIKKKTSPEDAIEALYLSTLARRPSDAEAKEALAFIQEGSDASESYAGVLWMLLNRSEFLLLR
ncbi:MAG: DUF1553 domain-containing protein [Planctomycetota bacterium]